MFSRSWLSALFLAASVAVPGALAAQTKDFSQTVDLASGGRFRIDGSKGDVRVTAWDEDRVEIKARIEAPEDVSGDYAQRSVEATQIDVHVADRSVTVRSNYDDVPTRARSWGGDSRTVPYVHYEIRAPRQIELEVVADRGDAVVEGFSGTIDVETDRGELTASNLQGEIRLSIDRGGTSRLTGIAGSLDIEADRTDVSIRDLSISGDSRVEIDRGDLECEMPATQTLSINAEMSRRANLDSDFDITLERQSRHVLRGTINGGGPELSVEADRSTIRLRRLR